MLFRSMKVADFRRISECHLTLGAGLNSTSTDPITHNSLSAEQKIYGPLDVKTAVTDIGRAGESRSVSARLKLTW